MAAEIVPIQPELFDDPAMYSMRMQMARVVITLNKAVSTLDKVRKAHWGGNNEQNQRIQMLEERLTMLESHICKGCFHA